MRVKVQTVRRGPDASLNGQVVIVSLDGAVLEGVKSVTWMCAGRHSKPSCVLVLDDVDIEADADLDPAQAAAVRLLLASQA